MTSRSALCALAALLFAASATAETPRLTACEAGPQQPVRNYEREPDGTARWVEVCGGEILRCEQPPGDERQCIVSLRVGQEPLEKAIARALTVKLNARRSDPARVYGKLFDVPRALVLGTVASPHPGVERVLLPIQGMPAAAICEVTPGYFTGPMLAELLGPKLSRYEAEPVSVWEPGAAPGIHLVLRAGAASSDANLALDVTFDPAGSVACLSNASPVHGQQFQRAEQLFIQQMSWSDAAPHATAPALRWATSPRQPNSGAFEARREQDVKPDGVRGAEHELERFLRVLLPPHSGIERLSISRSWERSDKRGRLLQATLEISNGTRGLQKLASPVWGVPNRQGICIGVVDSLSILTPCRPFAGVVSQVATEHALARAANGPKPFRLEQQEYRPLVHKDEPTRVLYERAATDTPGTLFVTIGGERTPVTGIQ